MSEEEKQAIEKLEIEGTENNYLEVRIVLNLIDKLENKLNTLENKLEKHIKFCEQEASGSLHNEICHIALKFDKSLLNIIKE